MTTLRQLKEYGFRISLHCRGERTMCAHFEEASWDQLIQYFGPDADLYGDRSFLNRLVCERCGGRGATVIVTPGRDTPGMGGGSGGHANHGPLPTPEEQQRRREAFDAEFRRQGGKSNSEIAAEARAARRAARKAEKSAQKQRGQLGA